MKKANLFDSFITLIYSLLEIVDARLRKIPTVLEVLRFYQFTLIIYYCLRFTFILPQYNIQQMLVPTLQDIDNIIILKQPFQILLILFFSFVLIFFVMLVVAKYRILGSNYTQIISWLCVIISIASRVVWFWIIQQILYVFVAQNSSYPIIGYFRFFLAIPFFIYAFYIQLILRNQYMYGILHCFIPVSIFISANNIVLFFLIGGMFLYVNLIDRRYPHRILCNSIMPFVFWGISRYFFDYVEIEELIIVLVAFICGIIHHFYWGTTLQLNDDQNKTIVKMSQFLNRQKDSKIKQENEIMIFESHLSLFLNSSQFSLQDQQLLEQVVQTKDIADIEKSTHFKLIQIFGKVTKQPNNIFQLFIYDVRLNEGKDYYESLLTIYNLYHSQSTWNFIAKYELAKLLIKIQNWLIKFRHDSTKTDVWGNVNLEIFIIRFYNQLEECMKKLYQAWNSMNTEIVDFQKIWTNFASALKIKQKVEDDLEVIVNKYKRIEQLVKYNSIMNSLNFPKFNRLPLQTLTIQTQPRASYIKICENKIVAQSMEFKTLFKYQFQELHLASVCKLSPLKKSIFTDQLTIISNLKLIDRRYPILDAYHHLSLVRLQVFLEPNVVGKIEYIIFISPIYTKNQSYILYNFETDRIQEASKGFCDTFGIDVSLFHSFIQKPFLGKQVFEHLNFNCSSTLQQLESDSGVSTQINTTLLNPEIEYNAPKDVYLKIILKFDDEQQKKCIIRIHQQRLNNTQMGNGTNIQQKQNLSTYTKQLQREKSYNQIIDKKATLGQSSKNTLDMVSIAFTVLVILAAIVSSAVFYYCEVWYDFLLNYIEGINIRSISLLDILFQEFSLMHLTNWPPSVIPTQQLQNLISNLQVQLQKSLYVIQDKTIYSLVTINLPLVNRDIQSYGYSLKSTESGLDLFFNIVYSAPLIFTESVVAIMIERYNDVIEFATEQNFIEPYLVLLKKFEIVTVVLSGICLCLLPVVQIYRIVKVKAVEMILSNTQELFSFTEQNQVISKIKMIKKSLLKLRDPLQQEEFKINQTFRSQRSNHLMTKKSISSTKLSVKQITKFRPLFQTICIMIMQVLVVGFFFLTILSNILTISKEYPAIINYQQSLSDQQIALKTSFLTIYFDLVNLKVNNVTPPNFTHPTSFIDNTVIRSFTLPNYFQNYSYHSWQQTNKDLCKLQFARSEAKKCLGLIGGSMKSGASKTLEIYWDKINQLNNKTLDDLYVNPLFEQLYFMEGYLLAFIQEMRDNFVSLQKQYILNKRTQFIFIMLIGFGVIVISAALGYYHEKQYNQKKSICQALFNIFPEQNFRREDVRQFVAETNIIDKLSTL